MLILFTSDQIHFVPEFAMAYSTKVLNPQFTKQGKGSIWKLRRAVDLDILYGSGFGSIIIGRTRVPSAKGTIQYSNAPY